MFIYFVGSNLAIMFSLPVQTECFWSGKDSGRGGSLKLCFNIRLEPKLGPMVSKTVFKHDWSIERQRFSVHSFNEPIILSACYCYCQLQGGSKRPLHSFVWLQLYLMPTCYETSISAASNLHGSCSRWLECRIILPAFLPYPSLQRYLAVTIVSIY